MSPNFGGFETWGTQNIDLYRNSHILYAISPDNGLGVWPASRRNPETKKKNRKSQNLLQKRVPADNIGLEIVQPETVIVKWSRDRRRHLTLKGHGRDTLTPVCFGALSSTMYIISKTAGDSVMQKRTNRKWHLGYRMLTCALMSLDPNKSRSFS